MKVLICGYGRMGREIERLLPQFGHTLTARVDPVDPEADYKELTADLLVDKQADGEAVDVVIEFSTAAAVLANVQLYCAAQKSVVIGTTGWQTDMDQAEKMVRNAGICCLHGANFSIGVNLFRRVAQAAAGMIAPFEHYDIMLSEGHHRHKLDAPSGTARLLAEEIISALPRKREIVSGNPEGAIKPHQLHVASLRGGALPGTHSVLIDSESDSIELRHTARNRRGFAIGAIMAADWVAQKRARGESGFFGIDEFMDALLAPHR